MTNYAAGRRREWRTQRILEAIGYVTIRTAGSRGPVDVIGWNSHQVRLIQVKAGARALGRLSPVEREQLELMPCPPGASVELWRYQKGKRDPVVEVIR